jgi:hypothetical protein
MLVDTNLLVYATFVDAPEHEPARRWLEGELANDGAIVLCWPVLYAFLRLMTSARVFGDRAVGVRDGWHVVSTYLAQSGVRVVAAGSRHQSIASELAATPGLRSDDAPDVQLAALAIEHGLVLASHDHGFRRFASLRFLDPLT